MFGYARFDCEEFSENPESIMQKFTNYINIFVQNTSRHSVFFNNIGQQSVLIEFYFNKKPSDRHKI